jgi:hypothetical protein
MQERRKHPRYDIIAQIRVKRGRINYIMSVKDLSISGIFVATDRIKELTAFRVDQELEMDLFVPDILDNVRVHGRIVRIQDQGADGDSGFGVRFANLCEEDVK